MRVGGRGASFTTSDCPRQRSRGEKGFRQLRKVVFFFFFEVGLELLVGLHRTGSREAGGLKWFGKS